MVEFNFVRLKYIHNAYISTTTHIHNHKKSSVRIVETQLSHNIHIMRFMFYTSVLLSELPDEKLRIATEKTNSTYFVAG